ncbi:branched-chain amino acid transaminase 2 [Actinidia rufa]|uniref:Branched-chain amino acid transaminase 2 n=1 Tax=Actinidia rufa TaxID=165716 RepID=A0A7J0GH30_9ERIC|nr:branched-chain amino acid transaminase 2 [Actinidia rufa]
MPPSPSLESQSPSSPSPSPPLEPPATNAAAGFTRYESPFCSSGSDDECGEIDWDNLGFGIKPTDYMYVTKCTEDGVFQQGQLNRYGNIELNPSAGVLNYGQGIFKGTKAFRREDGGLFLFCPDQNAIGMQYGADRMCMPSPSIDQFINGGKQTALANRRWIPPPGKGYLYIRPVLIGSGPILGLSPAPEYTFLVYSSPVSNYFNDEFHRGTRGGVGGVKSVTNYAPVLKALTRAKSRGFSDVIYLNSVHKKYREEATSCNVFVVKGNRSSTPPTSGNILRSITRKTVIDIAHDHGYQVEKRTVPVQELLDGDEVFCTGTAGSITHLGKRSEDLATHKATQTLSGLSIVFPNPFTPHPIEALPHLFHWGRLSENPSGLCFLAIRSHKQLVGSAE